jgi:hypothetical protein
MNYHVIAKMPSGLEGSQKTDNLVIVIDFIREAFRRDQAAVITITKDNEVEG